MHVHFIKPHTLSDDMARSRSRSPIKVKGKKKTYSNLNIGHFFCAIIDFILGIQVYLTEVHKFIWSILRSRSLLKVKGQITFKLAVSITFALKPI